MADENRKDQNGEDLDDPRLKANPREDNNEWLQGQMGEDKNVSGASTYRTLPDQPGTKSGDEDASSNDRSSNR
ncbi:MAG TPA: hypothetical protein VHB25_17505 [Gemmatimonadaceae bacterium]|nr:hypothetical protein [Gemmatimonadaceae bacterium]